MENLCLVLLTRDYPTFLHRLFLKASSMPLIFVSRSALLLVATYLQGSPIAM